MGLTREGERVELNNYQAELVERLCQDQPRVLERIATGAGRAAIILATAYRLQQRGERVLVLTAYQTLVEQLRRAGGEGLTILSCAQLQHRPVPATTWVVEHGCDVSVLRWEQDQPEAGLSGPQLQYLRECWAIGQVLAARPV